MAVDHLTIALHELANLLGDAMTAICVGEHFTCREAEIVADVLIESGHTDAARAWLHGHAMGDDGSDDAHGVCRYCDALLLVDGVEVTDTFGSAWCAPDKATYHTPTSWALVGEEK